MDALPPEALQRVVLFAIPANPSLPTQGTSSTFPHSIETVRRSMSWVAGLRHVNQHWKNCIDDRNALLWFRVAEVLRLDPPTRMYSGGTYRDACKFLLDAEEQRSDVDSLVRAIQSTMAPRADRTDWVWVSTPSRRQMHPHPELPRMLLPPELRALVLANASALQSFLTDFIRAMKSSVRRNHEYERWHESAFNRYRMFLQLKRDNPSVWLVPTMDIEFCWLAHIFRTDAYIRDMTTLNISPDQSLCLASYGEVATFSEAVRATATLWKQTFGENYPYLRPGTRTHVTIWEPDEGFSEVRRNDPHAFFPRMGAAILTPPVGLPAVSITAQDIQADLTRVPRLLQAFNENPNLSVFVPSPDSSV